jgi:hypothetical protein
MRYLGIEVDNALEISEQTEIWRRRYRPHAKHLDRDRAAAISPDAVRVIPANYGRSSTPSRGQWRANTTSGS